MSPRSRFVLVHGTFHGGWCWQRVADRLRRAGSCVYTPTLAGLAERACELSAAIGLESHVADLASLLLDNDLYDVVLVGHSYGGMVVTGAADRCRERIRTLVYLDATIPVSGMSQDALRGRVGPRDVISVNGVACLPVPRSPHPFGVDEEQERRWLEERLTPHPLRTKTDPLILSGPLPAHIRRVYDRCGLGWDGQPRVGEPSDRWRPELVGAVDDREITAVHDAMVTDPDLVARVLLSLARPSGAAGGLRYARAPHHRFSEES